jgi:DNA-binding CsgD family transcriptional regulator
MMNTQIITDVVVEFIKQDKLFTSVDIANEIKTRGEWVRNSEVASFLRNKVISLAQQHGLDYEMVPISVSTPTGFAHANVYFMTGDDPYSYTNTTQKAMTPDEFLKLHPGKTVPGWYPTTGKVIGIVAPPNSPGSHPITTKVEDEKSVKGLKDRFGFTEREAQTAAYMLEGKTIAEISSLMGIVPQSVYAYRHEIKLKLDARNSKAPVAILLEDLLAQDTTKSQMSKHAAVNFIQT